MLAGLMTATLLSAAAPAQAQRSDEGRGGGRGERGNWNGGGNAGAGWRGGDRAAQPRADRSQGQQVQGDRGAQWRAQRMAQSAQAQPSTQPQWQGRQEQRRQGDWQASAQNRQGWRQDDRRDGRDGWRDDRSPRAGGWNGNGRVDNGRRFDDRSRWSNQRRWDNGWRNDRRYDWQNYRSRYGDRYRAGRYYAPRGWDYGYRRFSIGIFLSNMLYADNYWLNDPYSYRLPPAYGSLRWVRYYDDALLVDVRDGYVVDVIHDFFW